MGFDAGSITGHLKLDSEEFLAELEDAKLAAKKFSEKPIVVTVQGNTDQFDVAEKEVTVKKKRVSTKVTVPVNMDAKPFISEAAIVEAEKKLLADGVTIPISYDVTPGLTLLQHLMNDKGMTQSKAVSAISNLGVSTAEIKQIIAANNEFTSSLRNMAIASAQTQSELSSAWDAIRAFDALPKTYSTNWQLPQLLALTSGGNNSSILPALAENRLLNMVSPLNLSALGSADGGPNWNLGYNGSYNWNYGYRGSYGWNFYNPGGPNGGGSGGGSLVPFTNSRSIVPYSGGLVPFASVTSATSSDISNIIDGKVVSGTWLAVSSKLQELSTLFKNGFSQAGTALSSSLNDLNTKVKSSFTSLDQSFKNMNPILQGAIFSMLSGVGPIIGGAVGAAAGGALAGIAIGGAGLAGYGLLAKNAYGSFSTAYKGQVQLNAIATQYGTKSPLYTSALQQYQTSTANLNPLAISTASQAVPIIASISSTMNKIQTPIFGTILNFLKTFQSLLPVITPFLTTATSAMTNFFNSVMAGLKTAGFASFMKTMTKDVGPIMKDFGATTMNVFEALSNLLVLFAPVALKIGNGFVSLSSDFLKFTEKIKFGPGFLAAMKTVGKDLTTLGSDIMSFLKIVASASAPIGLFILNFITKLANNMMNLLKYVDPNTMTLIAGLTLALIVLAKVGDKAPVVILLTGVVLLLDLLHKRLNRQLINLITDLAAAVMTAFVAIGLFNGVMGVLDVVSAPWILAISAIVLAGLYLQQNWSNVSANLQQIWGDIERWFEEGVNTVIEAINAVIDAMNAVGGVLGFSKIPLISLMHLTVPTNGSSSNNSSNSSQPQPMGPFIPRSIGPVAPPTSLFHMTGGTPRALGGPVVPGSLYRINERGQEMFTPGQTGWITPSNPTSHSITINVDARGSSDPTAMSSTVTEAINKMLPNIMRHLTPALG